MRNEKWIVLPLTDYRVFSKFFFVVPVTFTKIFMISSMSLMIDSCSLSLSVPFPSVSKPASIIILPEIRIREICFADLYIRQSRYANHGKQQSRKQNCPFLTDPANWNIFMHITSPCQYSCLATQILSYTY